MVVTSALDENPVLGSIAPNRLLPNLQKNWVSDPEMVERLKNEVWPILQWTRKNRMELEENWRAVRRMLLMQHDEGQRYIGRSNSYIPAWARALITLTSQVSRGLFPSDEYMDVTAKEGTDAESARAVKS